MLIDSFQLFISTIKILRFSNSFPVLQERTTVWKNLYRLDKGKNFQNSSMVDFIIEKKCFIFGEISKKETDSLKNKSQFIVHSKIDKFPAKKLHNAAFKRTKQWFSKTGSCEKKISREVKRDAIQISKNFGNFSSLQPPENDIIDC